MLGDDLRIALGMAIEHAKIKRHEFLTTEHLLHGLLHDPAPARCWRPAGPICARWSATWRACSTASRVIDVDEDYEPLQTPGFRRVLSRAITHVQSSGKGQVDGGNVLVALFSEADSGAVSLLTRQGVSRLDVVSFISHGVRKGGSRPGDPARVPQGTGPDADPTQSANPETALADFCADLYEKASKGKIDPLIGRDAEVDRIVHVLARRKKNNPLLIGDPGVGKTAVVEGLARRIFEGRRA
jgi:ATP-dependent Clp protease ATP-binding subunit ClpA